MPKRKVKELVTEVVKKATTTATARAPKKPSTSAKSPPPSPAPSPPQKPKKAKQEAPAFIERTPIEPREHKLHAREDLFHILCWNVAGLRGTLKNNKSVFDDLVQKYNPHIICLQETKIQPSHEVEFNSDPDLLPGYFKFWCSSVVKKGYSGTALFVKQDICGDVTTVSDVSSSSSNGEEKVGKAAKDPKVKKNQKSISSFFGTAPASKKKTASATVSSAELQSVSCELGEARFSGEGRTITAEFDKFFLVNCYVPNSGQTLDRLDYRTEEWDPFLYKYLKDLENRKPVIFTGDLNVAHLDLDIHNPDAKHLVKQAGVTPRERASFGALLATGFQDALRYFYPDHEGQFTYWSQRTSARPVNKGLRLDYFLCSHALFPTPSCTDSADTAENADTGNGGVAAGRMSPPHSSLRVLDSTVLFEDTVGCSDHCPVMLTCSVSSEKSE